jgi:hypothetical protein
MTSHRFALVASAPIALAVLAGAAACSSSSSATGGPGLPAGCPTDPFSTNGLDQTKVDRLAFCQQYVGEINDKANALGCKLDPAPTCPKVMDDFESTLGVPACSIVAYSQGTAFNCECRIASYSACTDFANLPCVFGALTDPSACGGDGGTDTGGGDSLPDTSAVDDSGDAGGGG